tara:strand:- start:360 stop:491 length:132 start_codon:yes stop_codon:yes gene_type:complete
VEKAASRIFDEKEDVWQVLKKVAKTRDKWMRLQGIHDPLTRHV